MALRTLDQLDPRGKRVLVRADLNVPVHDGKVTDATRIERLAPTLRELADKGGRVVVLSHFERPGGKVVPSMSLRPLAEALAGTLGRPVRFCDCCVGADADAAVAALHDGELLLLENTRFYPGEEKNEAGFATALAAHGDVFVNDAFSAAHRAHASTEGLAHHLPAYAGRLMQEELTALASALTHPQRPVAAVVGGAKVSTKLDLLHNLLRRVDVLAIGGAMANTFLAARGLNVGRSLQEPGLHETARSILAEAATSGCELVLPVDGVLAAELSGAAATHIHPVEAIPADMMMLDVGPASVADLVRRLGGLKTLVWNGPLGAFETPPFDAGTVAFARAVAAATANGLLSVAGGGDTVSALRVAGVEDKLTYVSSAGGAFLEWMEGKSLPGVVVLEA